MTNEEIIRGAYSAGKRRITCPVCNGGDDHEQDTMSLWLSEYGVNAKCYRAKCGAYIHDGGPVVGWQAPAFEPRPLKAPYRLVTHEDAWGKEWASRLEQDPFFGVPKIAHERGFRVLSALPDVAVWRLRALDGTLTGHITRTLDKKISTYKDLDRALYYFNYVVTNDRALFVFEDAMSAALCSRPAIALLGTSIPAGLVEDIKNWHVPDTVLVCLDPGAEDAGMKVYNKLTQAGVPATFVPMSKDFKDMTVAERRELEEVYA